MGKKKSKTYHKVVSYQGNKHTFIEFGWIENPTFKNQIYMMVNSHHKGGSGSWEYRIDEALICVEGFARAVNKKITGIQLERIKEIPKGRQN